MQKRISAAWSSTVSQLHSESANASRFFSGEGGRPGTTRREQAYEHGITGIARVIDKPSGSTILVDWSDPGRCYYGAQLWRAGVSRQTSKCALSQKLILPGDRIYRPTQKLPLPRNLGAMILVSSLGDDV